MSALHDEASRAIVWSLLVVVGDLLRVANDRSATTLWPTAAEEHDIERDHAERERAARRPRRRSAE